MKPYKSGGERLLLLGILLVLVVMLGLLALIYTQRITPQPAQAAPQINAPVKEQAPVPAEDWSSWPAEWPRDQWGRPIPPIQEVTDPNWKPSQPGEVEPARMIPYP